MLTVNEDFQGLRSIICYLRYSKANNKLCVPFLIETIKRNIHKQHISSLIYACSQYDCNSMCFIDAYYVIENMKNINELDKLYAINKLKAFLEIVGEEYELKEEIIETIELLSGEYDEGVE